MESAFAKVRREATQDRLRGGPPLSDEAVAKFIDGAMDAVLLLTKKGNPERVSP